MLNLLMLLLLMVSTTKEPTLQLQPVQQSGQEVMFKQEIGRTERPLNQRTQVTNVYLDSVYGYAEFQTIPDMALTKITPFVVDVTGKYPFGGTNGTFTIPTNGTYIVQVSIHWNVLVAGDYHVSLLKNGLTQATDYHYYNGVAGEGWANIMQVKNYNKGDYFEMFAYQVLSTPGTADLEIKFTITKIS